MKPTIDPTIGKDLYAFYNKINQTADFYKKAVLMIAAEKVNEELNYYHNPPLQLNPEKGAWIVRIGGGFTNLWRKFRLWKFSFRGLNQETKSDIHPYQAIKSPFYVFDDQHILQGNDQLIDSHFVQTTDNSKEE